MTKIGLYFQFDMQAKVLCVSNFSFKLKIACVKDLGL